MTETCVCCGEEIPEGRQVCRACEQAACQHVWIFDLLEDLGNKHLIHMRCQLCGARRTDRPVKRNVWPEYKGTEET